MKNILENFLVWCLGKLNIQRLKKITIDEHRVVIGISKYISDDNKWHYIGTTVTAWIKISKTKKGKQFKMDDVAVYLDGGLKAKYKLQNAKK